MNVIAALKLCNQIQNKTETVGDEIFNNDCIDNSRKCNRIARLFLLSYLSKGDIF